MSYTDTQAQSPLIINQMPTATYEETTKSSSEVYVVTDPAGKNMNNLTDTGYSVLNNSKALETGAVCSDAKIYSDVHKYAHSTFDLSKFNIIGSPTITDDGIASGFSSSNKINKALSLSGSKIRLQAGFFYKTVTETSTPIGLYQIGTVIAKCWVSSSNKIVTSIFNSASEYLQFTTSDIALNEGDFFIVTMDFGNNSTLTTTVNNITRGQTATKTSTNVWGKTIADVTQIFMGSAGSNEPYPGFIDLKYYSVTVDGIPFFSGNKTGIDTIKPDDYTVVGSPTISADGILTTSSYNYVKKALTIAAGGSYTIKGKITIGQVNALTIPLEVVDSSNNLIFSLRVHSSDSKMICFYKNTGGTTTSLFTENNSIAVGNTYDYTIAVNGSNLAFTFNGVAVTPVTDFDNVAVDTVFIGTNRSGVNAFVGTTDLNALEIIENGAIIYQPCLKIPYTKSSDKYGSKIVDSVYRPRVTDTYNQGYPNRYYTIDEVNKNFTLPMGEIYGLIETTVERNQLVAQSLNVVQNSQEKGLNKNIFNSLKDDFHSTFDKSKFTVVGTPTITEDGVITYSTGSDYVKTGVIIGNSPFKITVKTSWLNASTGGLRLYQFGGGSSVSCLYVQNGFIRASLTLSDDSSQTITIDNLYGNDILVTFEFTGTQYILTAIKDGVKYTSSLVSSLLIKNISTLEVQIASSNFCQNGSIDLKQFLIESGGYPIFTGTKTGLDIIKPNNYEITGSLTVSDDGVATGFSGSNYFSTSVNLSSAWEATFSFKLIELESVNVFPFLFYSGFNRIDVHKSKHVIIFADENNTTDHHINLFEASAPFKVGVNYLLTIKFDGTSIYSGVLVDLDNNVTYRDSQTLAYKFPSASTWNFYRAPFAAVDLNLTKIYVNGNLVFQPCLKIPYVSSRDGKKMVYPVYQSRVQDCYEQFGQANYTVIDEENKEYFLPLGSASGFYGKRVLADSYRSGINYWEVYSDGTIEQGGSCTSGTAVNLLKPFADTNYVVTVPYSAKTKTSFTPTQTGDWIAKGQGSL